MATFAGLLMLCLPCIGLTLSLLCYHTSCSAVGQGTLVQSASKVQLWSACAPFHSTINLYVDLEGQETGFHAGLQFLNTHFLHL